MPYLTIGNCVLTIEDCPIAIGDPCGAPCAISLLDQGSSQTGTEGDLTLTYNTPDNSGLDVVLYLYFYADVSAAITVDNGFSFDTSIDNGVDGILYRYYKYSADNLTGETVSISTTLAGGRISALLIGLNLLYNDNGLNSSGANVTTLTATLPSGTSAAATVDGAFTVLAQPFGHTFGGDFWTVDDANAVLLGNEEAGGATGIAISAWYWPDSTTDGIPGTITWNSDGAVSRPEIDYMYFLCENGDIYGLD